MAGVAMGTEAEEMVEDETEEPNEQRRPADEVEVAHTRYLHSSSSWRPPSACASRPLSCMASSSGGGEGVEWRRGGISWEWREGRLRRNRSSFEVTQKLVQGHAGPAKRGGAGCPEGGVPLDVALVRIVFVYYLLTVSSRCVGSRSTSTDRKESAVHYTRRRAQAARVSAPPGESSWASPPTWSLTT
jgi:hypothetical protein